ncbi:hypothetical protein [Actinomadura sp. 9N407]
MPYIARAHNVPLAVLERMAAHARGNDLGPEGCPEARVTGADPA